MKTFIKNEAVQHHVESLAASIGNKAANLVELDELCHSIHIDGIQVKVPEILPIHDETIQKHLDQFAGKSERSLRRLRRKTWRELWAEFVEEQKGKKTLTKNSIAILRELKKIIADCFKNHPITIANIADVFPNPEDSLMSRSTGAEDTATMANPGGNETVPAVKNEKQSISEAIGIVIASYLSEKSLTQRLLSNDDITKPLFLPVLLQKMIGEQLNGNDDDKIVVSGVIYAKETMTRIEAALGQGELIVNSKAPFDTFDVTEDNIVHPQIYHKTLRLVPTEDNKTHARKLVFKENPKQLRGEPSFPLNIARAIAEVGNKVAEHYGIPMDIEFVYQPHDNTLYLVQARPIPAPNNRVVKPSSISPESWLTIKNHKEILKQHGSVISPADKAAKMITNLDQAICDPNLDTIKKALDYYLDQPNIQNNIKAVFVKKNAPSNSHEAAEFNTMGIPVVVCDTPLVESWLKEENPNVVLDVQRQQIINWGQYANQQQLSKTGEDVAKLVFAEGLFSSPLAPKETLLPLDLTLNEEITKRVQNYLAEKNETIERKHIYSELLNCFEHLEEAKPNHTNDAAKAALSKAVTIFKLLATSSEAHEKHSVHKALFTHAIVTAAEISHYLDEFSKSKEYNQELHQEYLDLVNKLKALTINPGEEYLYSDSIEQLAEQNKIFKMHFIDRDQYTPFERGYLQEFLKLSSLALTDVNKERFVDFVKETTKRKKAGALAKIILVCHEYNLQSELVNKLFVDYYQMAVNHKSTHKNTYILTGLYKEICEMETLFNSFNLTEHHRIIASWENRISEWNEPAKFDRLFNELSQELLPLLNTLNIGNMPALCKKAILKEVQYLTDVLDRTIKSMKGSPEYLKANQGGGVRLLNERFVKLLTPYEQLMEKWMNAIPASLYDHWRTNIARDNRFNTKSAMIAAIRNLFQEKSKRTNEEKQLHPSGFVSVAAARVGTTASFQRQVMAHANEITLEDLFSLMHQNILASTTILGNDEQISSHDLPEPIQSIVNTLAANPSIQHLNTIHQPPNILLEYNIPLQNHSAKVTLDYNTEERTLLLRGEFFGRNWNWRMDYLSLFTALDGALLGGDLLNVPIYDNNKGVVEFNWQFKENQIPNLARHIISVLRNYADTTMTYANRNYEISALNKLFANYQRLDEDTLLQTLTPESIKNLNQRIKLETDRGQINLLLFKYPKIMHAILQKDFSHYVNLEFLDVHLKTLSMANLNLFINQANLVFDSNDAQTFNFVKQVMTVYSFGETLAFVKRFNIDLNKSSGDGTTLFEALIQLPRNEHISVESVKTLMTEYQINASAQMHAVETAISRNRLDLAQFLVDEGAPLTIPTSQLKELAQTNEGKQIVMHYLDGLDNGRLNKFLFSQIVRHHLNDPFYDDLVINKYCKIVDFNKNEKNETLLTTLMNRMNPEQFYQVIQNTQFDKTNYQRLMSHAYEIKKVRFAKLLLQQKASMQPGLLVASDLNKLRHFVSEDHAFAAVKNWPIPLLSAWFKENGDHLESHLHRRIKNLLKQKQNSQKQPDEKPIYHPLLNLFGLLKPSSQNNAANNATANQTSAVANVNEVNAVKNPTRGMF